MLDASGVGEGSAEFFGPLFGEDLVGIAPDDADRAGEGAQPILNGEEVVLAERDSVLMELLFAQRRRGEGAKVRFDGFVSEFVGIGEGSAESLRRSRDGFVLKVRNDEAVIENAVLGAASKLEGRTTAVDCFRRHRN